MDSEQLRKAAMIFDPLTDPLNQRDPGDEDDFPPKDSPLLDPQRTADMLQYGGRDVELIRKFETGATRNDDTDQYDYEGFLSPLVLKAFGEYMHHHRFQADGTLRAPDNWQKGIPLDSYMGSGWRHFMDWWLEHRGYESRDGLEAALCGLLFNVQGYLHEILKERNA